MNLELTFTRTSVFGGVTITEETIVLDPDEMVSYLLPADIGVSVAGLVAGKVPSSQLPSYVDDVLDFANFAALPGAGETGKIYVLATPYTSGGITSSQFRWSGSAYVPIVASPGTTDAVTEGVVNLYFSNARALAAVNPMTTAGDMVYGGTGGVPTRRAKGVDGQLLLMVGGLPAWANSPYVLQTTYDTDMGNIAAALAAILG
jgi:hypothetical protein